MMMGALPLLRLNAWSSRRRQALLRVLFGRSLSFVVDCLSFILTLNRNLVSKYHGVTGCKHFLFYQYLVRVIDILSDPS